jgi:outer membrane protein assembly factor BamD
MKKSVHFLFLVVILMILSSCKFQQVLKKGDIDQKYEMAMKLYDQKDYSRALQLFDPLINMMKATDKAQKLYYCYAYSYYYQKEYTLASYYFKRYTTNFPNTKEAEECFFMSAYCNYMNSPDYQLDQTSTIEAIKELQLFTNTYPESSRVSECNDLIDKIRTKLEYKDYKIAKMYYRMSDYVSAVTCFNNILKDYTDSPHKEEILYLIFKSYYKYAKESIESKKKERYLKAVLAYNELITHYPNSQYLSEVTGLKTKTDKELETINQQSVKISSTTINKTKENGL